MKMIYNKHIHSDPKILVGKPVIKGTRISVQLILELYEVGWTEEMILESYPTINKEQLKAAYEFGQSDLY